MITWFCEITWQTKTIISPISQCHWTPALKEWWVILSVFYPQCYTTLSSSGLAKLGDKLKPLYLYHYNVYYYQAWQGVSTIKSHEFLITWSFENTWQIKTTNFYYHNDCGHKIWQDGDLSMDAFTHKATWPYNHTWPCKTTRQTKNILYPVLQHLWLPNLTELGYKIRSFLL